MLSRRVKQVVMVYDEGQPRGLWRVGRIEEVIPGSDGRIQSVGVCVQSKTGQTTVLRRPVQHLFPLEVGCQTDSIDLKSGKMTTDVDVQDNESPQSGKQASQTVVKAPPGSRPRRSAAIEARDGILGCITD